MQPNTIEIEKIKKSIREIPDFPKEGINFKDISTLISDSDNFRSCTKLIVEKFKNSGIDYVASIESRGFIFGAPVAQALGVGFTLIRKPGKLPSRTFEVSYALEYGMDRLQIHQDAFADCLVKGREAKVLILDDLLATGGSAAAAIDLISKAGAKAQAVAFIIELGFLDGRKLIEDKGVEVFSLVKY
jgi:adenine phosphoribosyltransferase